jgi:hypothetical protein
MRPEGDDAPTALAFTTAQPKLPGVQRLAQFVGEASMSAHPVPARG